MNKLKAYDVILSPVITEKATQVSEANQVIFKVATRSRERSPEHVLHGEDRRPRVEAVAAGGPHAGAPTGRTVAFDHDDVVPTTREVARGREPAEPRADDDDPPAWCRCATARRDAHAGRQAA